MPHTRSKKKKLAAQLAALNAEQGQGRAHTKRTQIVGEDGWTHVVDVGKGRKYPALSEGKVLGVGKGMFSIGDFEIGGVAYVDRTMRELERDTRYYVGKWEESGEGVLRDRLTGVVRVEVKGKEEGEREGEGEGKGEGEGEGKEEKKGRLERKSKKKINNIVCLGLGSLQSARREGRRASFMQLAALRTLISIIGTSPLLNTPLPLPLFFVQGKPG